ncbi:hypothetical protein MRX96_005923 [Rhipicephalus microplus]
MVTARTDASPPLRPRPGCDLQASNRTDALEHLNLALPRSSSCSDGDYMESDGGYAEATNRHLKGKLRRSSSRKARVAALSRQLQRDENAAFVNVATHSTRKELFTVVIIRVSMDELINAATVRAKTPGQTEEAAIGLAMGVRGIKTIQSDSKTAIENYTRITIWGGG